KLDRDHREATIAVHEEINMRVAMVTEWFDAGGGGVAVHIKYLAEYLMRYDVEVEIITGCWNPEEVPVDAPVHVIKGPKDPFFKLNISPGTPKEMREIIKKGDFDVVHAHHAFARIPLNALAIARDLGIRSILTTHTVSFMPDYEYLWKTISYGYPAYRMMLSKADEIIAVSVAAKKFISHFTDVPVVVIPNGVDTHKFRNIDKQEARKIMGFGDEAFFLYVGRLVSKKGLFTLLLAFKDVLKEIPEAKLRIAGKGKLKPILQSFVNVLGINENVEFLGFLPGELLNPLFSSADIFVLPSSFGESFGIVILEAMASGTPVIGTRVGGVEEILGEGNGILVPPSDPSALADAMVSLINDVDLQKKIVKRALQKVKEKYDWRLVARKVVDVYKDVH
ncbi:MAG TPA: glycosyltransferase family 1 protein, partial [Thermoplasmatales archaeon]|nr:glycosyltransferase family 1 protein [Thermoplasmatales archaeon]